MSIQSEIERLSGAKQDLADWLLDHDVEVSFNAKLDELVGLLADVSTDSGEEKDFVHVEVKYGSNTLISKTVTPPGSSASGTLVLQGAGYEVPADSLMVVYASATSGGTAKLQAYIDVTITGDITYETVYQTVSNSSAVKPVYIAAVKVGTQGGTITFTRKTSSGSIM